MRVRIKDDQKRCGTQKPKVTRGSVPKYILQDGFYLKVYFLHIGKKFESLSNMTLSSKDLMGKKIFKEYHPHKLKTSFKNKMNKQIFFSTGPYSYKNGDHRLTLIWKSQKFKDKEPI